MTHPSSTLSAVATPHAKDRDDGRRGAPLAWALLATAVVMLLLLSGGGVWRLVGGQDLHGAFLPKYLEGARALLGEGRLPLWNPWELCGTPLFAVIQGLTLYLPVPLLFHFLSPYWALQGLYAFNLLVLAWGAVLYLRQHGIGAPAALLAVLIAVAGLFMSYSMVGYDHPNFLASVAWIPWMLLCWERAVGRGAWPWLALLALCSAAQWLAGYPDFPMDTAVLLGVVALVSGVGTIVRRVGLLAAGMGLGTALVAVQLVPLAEAVGESFRAEAMAGYVNPRQLFAVVSSGLFMPLVVERYGIAALVLAACALWRPTRTGLAWAAALVVATFAGDPPINLIYLLPGFASVRYALGWSHIAPLLLGFLVAASAQRGVRSGDRRVRFASLALVAWVALSCGWTIARAPRILRPVSPDYELLAERVPVIARIQDALPGRPRLVAQRETDSAMTVRARMPSATGYDPTMPPRRVARLIREIDGTGDPVVRGMLVERNPKLAGLMGVGLVAVPRGFAAVLAEHGFVPVVRLPPNDVLLFREPVPRARIVHQAIAARDEEASFAATADPRRDYARTTVVETTGPLPALSPPPSGADEEARVVVDLPERVEVDATLASPGLLVLTDTWYPGWLAEVDGEPQPILHADYAFRAVALPAGSHRVVFRYAPESLRVGAWVSATALGAVLILLVAPWIRRARGRER